MTHLKKTLGNIILVHWRTQYIFLNAEGNALIKRLNQHQKLYALNLKTMTMHFT